jgi:hypothetical protein
MVIGPLKKLIMVSFWVKVEGNRDTWFERYHQDTNLETQLVTADDFYRNFCRQNTAQRYRESFYRRSQRLLPERHNIHRCKWLENLADSAMLIVIFSSSLRLQAESTPNLTIYIANLMPTMND